MSVLRKKKFANNAFTTHNKVELLRGGKPFFDCLIKLINEATNTIHLQTYIYDDDATGIMVEQALANAVKRNVQVYLLADGYASQVMAKPFVKQLQADGIQFRFFEPIFRSKNFYFGRRLHHKVVVVDNRFALVGGINISDRYNDMPGQPAWLDFAIFAEGEIAQQLCVLCWKTWKGFPAYMELTPCEKQSITFSFPNTENSLVRMRRNDWVRGKNQISKSYLELLLTAKSHVIILSSYFIPGTIIRKAIVRAVKRGIKVSVIMASHSDVVFTKQAERYMYDWMLRNNIDIYEYQKNVLHGKLALCDGEWMTVGSYNVNDISAFASIELNLDVKQKHFVQNAEKMLWKIIENDCEHITKEKHIKSKNIFIQFGRWFSYQFIRFMLFIFTFYFKQDNNVTGKNE